MLRHKAEGEARREVDNAGVKFHYCSVDNIAEEVEVKEVHVLMMSRCRRSYEVGREEFCWLRQNDRDLTLRD